MPSAEQPLGPRLMALKYVSAVLLIGATGTLGAIAWGHQTQLGPWLVISLTLLALVLRIQENLRAFSFTAWVFAFAAAGMVWPKAFGHWFNYDLRFLIVPLVQVIMFGMGTKLSAQDFVRVLAMPRPVLIGVALHFGVMPLAGYSIARLFGFPSEVAAGVVLVGSVSSGVASNVIVYLARGNVALAVTITACSTLVSPLMTPFLMKTLAARLVPIDFVAMMIEVFSMVIVPVVAGLIAHKLLYGQGKWSESTKHVVLTGLFALVLAGLIALLPLKYFAAFGSLRSGTALGCLLVGLVVSTKVVVAFLRGPRDWMDKALPIFSMAGICLILAIIAARSRDRLVGVGALLVVAAILHNSIGYLAGYWLARLARLDESTCRTIAVEVGMQNGGMATGLAMGVLQSADAALAPAIFGTWMSISGSLLASWWRRQPVSVDESVTLRPLDSAASPAPELTRPKAKL